MPNVTIDGRQRLAKDKHQEIRDKYNDPIGKHPSQRQLAKDYNVSRRLIVFILYPDRLKAMQEKNKKEQHWKKYHNREQLTKAMQSWRTKLKADPKTRTTFLEYSHKMKARQWQNKQPKPCPYCGKTLKALRDHVRRVHNL
jgi:Zn-dependent peptidase ImmA (M78 family)